LIQAKAHQDAKSFLAEHPDIAGNNTMLLDYGHEYSESDDRYLLIGDGERATKLIAGHVVEFQGIVVEASQGDGDYHSLHCKIISHGYWNDFRYRTPIWVGFASAMAIAIVVMLGIYSKRQMTDKG
jgi:hypothetical protein